MTSKDKIPIIAVTPDDEIDENSSDNENEGLNIMESKTDTEDLFDSDSDIKTKKRTKINTPKKLVKNKECTDSEEIEGSEEEVIIQHQTPLKLEHLIESTPFSFEQTTKSNASKKKKLHSQQSTTVNASQFLNVNQDDEGTTDVEDMVTSDEEQEEEKFSEPDTLMAESCESSIIIDSTNKIVSGGNLIEEHKKRRNRKSKKLMGSTNHLTPRSLSPQLSDITDTEILHSDSDKDDENIQIKYRHKKHLKVLRKEKCLTDDEEILLSDVDTKIPKTGIDENTTDTEEFQEEDVDEIDDVDEHVDEEKINACLEATVSSYGLVTETHKPKEIFKSVMTKVRVASAFESAIDDNAPLTDVENYESDDNCESENNALSDNAEPVNIKFITAQKIKLKVRDSNKNRLNIPHNNDEVLTDVEEVKSSDEESIENEPLPLAIVATPENHTDVEIEEDDDVCTPPTSPISDVELPTPHREMVTIKTDMNGQPVTHVEDLHSDFEFGLNEKQDACCTDSELLSNTEVTDDEIDEPIVKEITFEFENDEIIQHEKTESPNFQVASCHLTVNEPDNEPITDSEVVVLGSNSKKKKFKKTKHMSVANPTNDNISDFDDSNIKYKTSPNCLTVNRADSLPEIKTDVEDLSDDDVKILTPNRALSITPDMLRNMNNEYVTLQEKDKSMPFNEKRVLKLPKFNPKGCTPEEQRTDTEDVFTSADEDIIPSTMSRDNSDLSEIKREFDAASDSQVHIKYSGKFDETEEVLHIKGGGYIINNPTDIEEIGFSDEDNKNNIIFQYNKEWSPASAAEIEKRYAATTGEIDKKTQPEGTETEQLEQDEAAGVEETEELKDEAESQTTSTRPKPAGSQHDLSEEMKALLAEMEEQSKR